MPNVLHQMIGEEATRQGIDPEEALAIASRESSFNPLARNPRSSAFGLFQMIDDTWRDHGVDPRGPQVRDTSVQIRSGVTHIRRNRDALSVALGRSPELAELYMAHVFGLGGARQILGHSDDTPIGLTRPESVWSANPWVAQAGITNVGQLRAWFRQEMERRRLSVRGLVDPTAVITPPDAFEGRLNPDDAARWPLHRFQPEHFRNPDGTPLNVTTRTATALDAIADEFGANAPFGVRGSRRQGVEIDLSSMPAETRLRFLGIAMRQGFTSFGFSRDRPDVVTLSTDTVGTATFRDTATGRNFLTWNSDGSARNFPEDHWAAGFMVAHYRRGRTAESPAPEGPRRHPAALTVTEAEGGVGLPRIEFPGQRGGGSDLTRVDPPTDREVRPYTPFTETERRELDRAAAADRPGFLETAGLAISNQWSILWALSNNSERFTRDPVWQPNAEWIRTNLNHLPTRYWEGIRESVSEDHARFIIGQAERAHRIEERLGSLGWGGVAANIAAAILDPAAIALAIASDGTLAPWLIARKVGTVSRILAMGASAGAQNAALEAILLNERPGGDSRDILYAALGGMVLGSAFAARPGRLLRDGFEALSGAAHRAREHIESTMGDAGPVIGGRRSAGAGEGPTFEPLNRNASEALQWARDNPAARPAYARARFDAVGSVLNSRHPLAAKTMDGLGEDAVGRVGHETNTLAATEFQTWYHRLNMNEFYRIANPAWQEYADRLGIRWFHFRERARAYDEFQTSVTRRIRQGVDAESVPPEADRLVTLVQNRYGKMLGDLKEPGKADGAVLPPVKGFENVEFNGQYTPRIWHGGKISQWRARFGDEKMARFFREAYLARNPHLLAGGEKQFVEGTKLAELFGKTFWKRLRQHRAGVSDDLNRALSGEDLEALKAQLYEALDPADSVGKVDVDKIVDGLRVAEHGGMARAQQRAMLDENFSARMADRDGNVVNLRVDDLLENSAERLFQMYSRNISGALAMARLGYPSLRDFERRLAHIRASADEVKGYTSDELERDIRNLEYVATYVTGSPVGSFGRAIFDARSSRLGEYARVVRDVNFIRLMGQLGFAQAAETFSILGHMGIRTAFASVPSLRGLWRNARTGKLDDELAHELETWVGLGTDRLRNREGYTFRHEDFGDYLDPHHGERMAWVRSALETGKVGVGELSGANFVNTVLHRWAMRSIAQKFSDLADNPRAWNARRLAAYGLDPDSQTAKDILEAIRAHRTTTESALGGRRLAQFNLEKWPEDVAENFSLVMHRVARHVIQENDPGNMHAYMSNPGAQLLFQFRHFMLVAHSKQLLHGLHMRDAFTATTFLGTMVSAGLAYILQTYAQSVGQRDRRRFLEERLTERRIGAASFSRAGWSALMPWFGDNIAAGLGAAHVPFGTRYSGLQPTGFLQNPTFDFANALYHIPFDAARAALRRDFDYSQQDFRRFHSVFPFQNANGIAQGLGAIGNQLPERSRRQ